MKYKHESVLLNETIYGLNINAGGIYVDGTFGGGGHTKKILDFIGNNGRIVAIDQDGDSIDIASKNFKNYNNINFINDNFSNIKRILKKLNINFIDGVILDLGVSSYQLDNPERGFSYKYDSILDMRMNRNINKTAKDIVNTYDENSLYHIIRNYGEDRFAKNIAKHICISRKVKEISTTCELVKIIKKAIPMKFRRSGCNPARKTFQAIRIELNGELRILEKAIDDFIDVLNPGGRICIITFHSLEDRIVKNTLKKNNNPCICPHDFPFCICGKKSRGKIITKKPIYPDANEKKINPRSRSAKLRIFEKINI